MIKFVIAGFAVLVSLIIFSISRQSVAIDNCAKLGGVMVRAAGFHGGRVCVKPVTGGVNEDN